MKQQLQHLLMVFTAFLVVSSTRSSSGSYGGKFKPVHEKTTTESSRQREKDVLDSILGSRDDNGFVYDARIRPQAVNKTTNETDPFGPTTVTVNIYLRTINDINDYKMELAVQITFRQKWMDPRLKFSDQNGRLKYLTLTDPKKVWMPDTFFRNEKIGHFHNILVNNVYIRIFPDGEVLYSIRISLTLSCPMNLKLYPMDRQTCALIIASYGYTADDIAYLWEDSDPVQLAQGLNLPRFNIEQYSSNYCNVKTNTGEYSCLSVDLVFKRQFSYYLITIYVPGCLLVIVSWVNFWLDPKAVPARVALGVTTLLTMSTQTASISSTLPPVAYTKAIDVWQGVCVGFVFSALMEYALVNYALRDNVKGRCPNGHRLYHPRHRPSKNQAYSYDDDDGVEVDMEEEELDVTVEIVKNGNIRHFSEDNEQQYRRHHAAHHKMEGNILLNPLLENPAYGHWLNQRQKAQHKVPTLRCLSGERSKRIDVTSRFLFPIVFALFNLAYWTTYLRESNLEGGGGAAANGAK